MKKALSLVLALVLVLSLSIFSFGAKSNVKTPEITTENSVVLPRYVDYYSLFNRNEIDMAPGTPGFSKSFNMNGRIGSGQKHNAFNVIVDVSQGDCLVTIKGSNGYSYSKTFSSNGSITISNANPSVTYTVKFSCPRTSRKSLQGSCSITSYVK